jgi:exosortase
LLVLGVGFAALLWAYWTTLTAYSRIWATNPSYSHGYLVPLFAIALLRLRRDRLTGAAWQGTYWGWALLAVGVGLRLVEAAMKFERGEYSLLLCLVGLFLLVGGWTAGRWALPSILFLGFMIPLPWSIEQQMPLPLQMIATESSTFLLQTIGLPAVSEGYHILLSGDKHMEIVEACSGLRMLMIFFALSTAMALVIKRPIWERAILLCSALPIALAANVIRITLTGILLEYTSSEWVTHLEHDMAGWVMMPLALGMLGTEFRLLQYIQEPSTAGNPKPRKAKPPAAQALPKPVAVPLPPPRPTTSWFPVSLPAIPPILARRQGASPPLPRPIPTVAAKPAVAPRSTAPAKQTMVAKPTAVVLAKQTVLAPPKPVESVGAQPAAAQAPPVPAVVVPKPVPVQPQPAVVQPVAAEPTTVRPTKKVTAAPKPVEPAATETPPTPRRTRKPWQPAKSSVAAGQPARSDGAAS